MSSREQIRTQRPKRTYPGDQSGCQNSVCDQVHSQTQGALKRESPGHSLQPTLLVNNVDQKLLEQKKVDPADRSLVMAARAAIICRLLVDYARTRNAQYGSGLNGRGILLHISSADFAMHSDALELNVALDVPGKENPRAAQVVELKPFGGLSGEEIAERN